MVRVRVRERVRVMTVGGEDYFVFIRIGMGCALSRSSTVNFLRRSIHLKFRVRVGV